MTGEIFFFVLPDLNYGGAQKTFCNIINQISKKHENNKLYLIAINKSLKVHNLDKRIKIVNLNSSRTIFSFYKLVQLILKIKPNYVFSTTIHINLLCIFTKILTFKNNTKFIIRESNPSFYRNDIGIFIKSLAKLFYNFSDHIICLSEFSKKNILDHIKINENKISTIYNPVNIIEIIKLSNEKNNINFSDKQMNLIFVGRLSAQKNIKYLIEIIKNLNLPNIKLRIIGNGNCHKNISDTIIKYKLRNIVEIIDFKKNPYIYIKKSDLFLLSSKWEGFGHVIAESLVLDTPVISINTKGIAKIFYKCKYFNKFNSSSIEKVSDYIKEKLVFYKSHKPIIDKSFLNEISTEVITQKYIDLIKKIK